MNQISMLVVDDEYMILEGMKKLLPYEEFGITHIETAENAEIALAYFANHAVDIVLTDVCMPEMTGLEMITKMKQLSSKTSYVMMSGFQEFDYVKQAISLGVKDYLVKPINKKELAQLLQALVKEKTNENALWQKVLKGQEPVQSLLSEGQKTYFLASLQKQEGFESLDMLINHQPVYVAFTSKDCHQESDYQEVLDAQSQLPEILERLERYLFYGQLSESKDVRTHSFYEQLLPLLESGQVHKLESELLTIVDDLKELTPAVYLSKQFFNHVMAAVYHHFQQLDQLQLEDYHLKVEATTRLTDLLSITLNHLKTIGDSRSFNKHVEEILTIIDRDYHLELTLKEVSERLFLNTVYLGQIIKKETGATFAELLNRKRIKMAQQHLMTGDQSIEEICFQVGYTNLGYFYKIFKRICGESPKSYRQKLTHRHHKTLEDEQSLEDTK
ncbi:response regulator [Streptococcus iniae]|uniref:DNA-binding response regulator n=1 Tax=Streptococcus iniae TaxID=1346 RepID=A0A3L8GPI3_STRIN|nr:response regulator [Streptococcus iniae]AGM98136.1 response regulator [Streptococcus iniae SF1]AHY15204.1 transcriptional regulator [Streptococcus iniae]AHY17072.1 transcriptional regulator [Streptococcus iniae]AJG25387.1 transcriptional regulator [Streptococcus iniae]APD31259.1 two-component system response regulator [Streptococcus iniae]